MDAANSSCGGLSEDSKRNQVKKFVKRIKSEVDSGFGSSINVQKCGFKSEVFSPSPSEIFVQNYSNFKQSGVPVRFMYYMNNTWIGFPKEVFELLKKGFMEGNLMLEVSIEGSNYLFDFLRMWQIDLVTGKRRFISWIDDKKKSFFPKIVSKDDDEVCRVDQDVPKVVIEVRINQNSIKRKREDESDSEESDSVDSSSDSDSDSDGEESSGESSSVIQSSIPKKPRIQTSAVFDKSNWRNVEILKEDDKSYKDVKNIFVSGLKKIGKGVTITSIYRCLHKGPLENVRMHLFLKQMELTKATRGVSNLKLAWHGTTSEGVANILSHGFGLLPSQISGSQPYGVGIYLSPGQSPETSVLVSEADHNGEKHALFCRVVVGNVEQVEEGSDQFHPSSERFDSGVDDLLNPRWYIVWSTHMNRHILPEYVVSYKTLEHTQEGLSRGTASAPKRTPMPIPARTTASVPKRTPTSIPNRTLAFVELFGALKSSLSSSTFQELEQVFSIYKERKISKEEMIRRLRSIAGDALIISTIRKIRSMGSRI